MWGPLELGLISNIVEDIKFGDFAVTGFRVSFMSQKLYCSSNNDNQSAELSV